MDQKQHRQRCRAEGQCVYNPQLFSGIDGVGLIFPETFPCHTHRHLVCQLRTGGDNNHEGNKLDHICVLQRWDHKKQQVHGESVGQAQRQIKKTAVQKPAGTHRHICHFHTPSQKRIAEQKEQQFVYTIFHMRFFLSDIL